jgi:hypothetical protein
MTTTTSTKKCLTSCKRVELYGQDVLQCFYDEQVACERLQPECKDEGLVVCKPRVVNLGAFDPRPAMSDIQVTNSPYMSPPPASSLPLMGP